MDRGKEAVTPSPWKPVDESAWKPVGDKKAESPTTFDHIVNAAKNFWGELAQTGQGMADPAQHISEGAKGIAEPQDATRVTALDALKRRDMAEAARHALSYASPMYGPAIDARGDQAQAGDVSGAVGG